MLSDLFRDPGTDQLSHTKIWNNVANVVATYVVIDMHLRKTLSIEWMLLYLAVVGGVGLASKFISMKFGTAQIDKQPSP